MPAISTDAPLILRVALGTPAVFALATLAGAPLPFVAALLFATLALKLRQPPPVRALVVLTLLITLLPSLLGAIAGLLNAYGFLLVGATGLMLLHGFRLQDSARTAVLGVLLQTFAIMLPMLSGGSDKVGGALSAAFALNGAIAVAGLFLAFALFPAPPAPRTPPAPELPRDARRVAEGALVSTLVIMPAFILLLAFDLGSAMRVLLTIATVLASLTRREARDTGVESVLSAVIAGATAAAYTLLHLAWPQPLAALLVMALLGLLVVPHALSGRHRGAVALAIPLTWVLIGTAEGEALATTLRWSLYSIIGVIYAVGARHLLLSLLRHRSPDFARP